MFTPVTARQEPSINLNIKAQDKSIITSYAINASSNENYRYQHAFVSPVQIERQEKEEPVNNDIPVQTASYSKPKVSPIPSIPPQQVVGPAELESFVEKYSAQYGARKDIMMIIMKCESGFNPSATNGPFAGLFQFMASTWTSNRNAMGLNPDPALRYNAEESIKTAAFKMGRDGYGAWPACSAKAFNQLAI